VSIGVSYYSFQAISYLADLYLEVVEPEKHFGRYTLYLALFPKLLQGPIERAADLLPQLRQPYRFDYEVARSGLVLFAWGLFKKLVLADSFAQLVEPAFRNVAGYSGGPLLFASYCYYIQLYFDFSGYTDMARGSARLFNLELSRNFDRPYLATSVADFWRRWHLSFSKWILDYIFKPLQLAWRGKGDRGTAAALLITFLVSGIWHGASWCFLAWGLLHGLYLAASVFYKPYQKRLYQALGLRKGALVTAWQRLVTFHLVTLAWVFFRAGSLSDALSALGKILALPVSGLQLGQLLKLIDLFGKKDLAAVSLFLALTLIVELNMERLARWRPATPVRWACYLCLVLSILLFARFHGTSEFIYLSF
jgi:D-alanyl-lipoteichoic acid acyltransferase DltB (MBOAT superfamily)